MFEENNTDVSLQPPVQVFGVEGRYATALYSAAMKKKSLDAVDKDIKELSVSTKTCSLKILR